MENIDAVILCGGLGKRLKQVSGQLPKVMVEVEGRPFLDILLEYLKKQGLIRIILCTGYKAKEIEAYYREHDQGLNLEFSKEETPLGTGGALKNCKDLIKSDSFFVLNGDSICPLSLKSLFNFHKDKQAMATLAISAVEKIQDFGSITLDQNNRIISFQEKQQDHTTRYVNAGVYCFDQEIFSLMPNQEKFSIEYDFFQKLSDENMYGFPVKEEFFDIGTPERYEKARKALHR